jgi:hypothetical protein
LLEKLQEAASTALADKAAVGSFRLQKQLQQQYRGFTNRSGSRAKAAAEAAAAVAATAGDGMGGPSGDDASTQQQQQQQQREWQSQLHGSIAGTASTSRQQGAQLHSELGPTLDSQQQQLDQPSWPVHKPATAFALPDNHQQQQHKQQQHESSRALPPPAAAVLAGGGGSRKCGRRVAVLEELHDADEQQHGANGQQPDAACAQGEVPCWVAQREPASFKQQQQQQSIVHRAGEEAEHCSSFERQPATAAAAEHPGQQGTMYGCQLECSITKHLGEAADAADVSVAAFALFGSQMPSMAAAEPLQLGEVAAEEADGADAAQMAAGADPKPAAATAGGWRQRKQAPGGRRRVSGSAAASLF